MLRNTCNMIRNLDSNYFSNGSKIELNAYAEKFIEGLYTNNNFEIISEHVSTNYICSFECNKFEDSSKFVMNYNLNTSSDGYTEFALFHEFIHIHQARLSQLLGKEICPSDVASMLQKEKEAWYGEYYALISMKPYLKDCHFSNGKYCYEDGTEVSVKNQHVQALIKFNDDPDFFMSELYGKIYSAQK